MRELSQLLYCQDVDMVISHGHAGMQTEANFIISKGSAKLKLRDNNLARLRFIIITYLIVYVSFGCSRVQVLLCVFSYSR